MLAKEREQAAQLKSNLQRPPALPLGCKNLNPHSRLNESG
jgi:hypothetical protein